MQHEVLFSHKVRDATNAAFASCFRLPVFIVVRDDAKSALVVSDLLQTAESGTRYYPPRREFLCRQSHAIRVVSMRSVYGPLLSGAPARFIVNPDDLDLHESRFFQRMKAVKK